MKKKMHFYRGAIQVLRTHKGGGGFVNAYSMHTGGEGGLAFMYHMHKFGSFLAVHFHDHVLLIQLCIMTRV